MAEASTFRIVHDHAYVEWKIQNYHRLPLTVDHRLQSPPFNVCETRWFIQIYPNGQSIHLSSGWIGLYLHKEKSEVEHRIAYAVRIKRADGTVLPASEGKYTFEKDNIGWGWPRFVERSALLSSRNLVAPDGVLTVICSIRSMNNVDDAPTRLSDGILTLSKSFKDLYEKRYYADVTLRVQNEEFRAHKIVLAARSTVFASKLQKIKSKKSKKKSGVVEIPDCDPGTFQKFLLFLYTGELDSVTSSEAVHLYRTSITYHLNDLKEECTYRMRHELSMNNFVDVVQLAYLYKESDLLKCATEFFIKNARYIITTPQWSTLLAENHSLGNELLSKLIMVQDSHNEHIELLIRL